MKKANHTLPWYVWMGGVKALASGPEVPEGETLAAFLRLFGMPDLHPPPRGQRLFPPSAVLCVGRHWGIHGAGGVAQATTGVGHPPGGESRPPPQSVHDAGASPGQEYRPRGGRPTKRGHEVVNVEEEERRDAPPPP